MGIYLNLFWSFFQVGLFSFGGGYASIPLIQEQVIEQNSWLTNEQFIDIITISESTPGPIAINTSTFVGTQIAGIPGALIATLGCITPSFFIVIFLAKIYNKYSTVPLMNGILNGLRPAVIALIANAGLVILLTTLFGTPNFPVSINDIDLVALVLFGIMLFLIRKYKMNPIIIIALAGVLGLVISNF